MAKKAKKLNSSTTSLLILLFVAVIISLGLVFLKKEKGSNTDIRARAGNNAPSGPHYNLNLIGVPKGKVASMAGDNGHRIFVPLYGQCKINLTEGDFQVLDGNCTDENQSAFALPNPDPENDGYTLYSVWARALGRPGGSSVTNTCATDPISGEVYCSVYQMLMSREKGRSQFTNVSRELLYIYADLNGDGTAERYNLFNDALKDYFWKYDNSGLKLVQLRFYQVSSAL